MTKTLKERGIGLNSLQESIDTTSSSRQLVFHLFEARAEFERNLIREITQAGLTAARVRGPTGGRPKLDINKRQLAVKLYNNRQYPIGEICQMMGISKPTLGYNYVFEFSPSTSQVGIDALVVRYANPTYWHKAIQDEADSNFR